MKPSPVYKAFWKEIRVPLANNESLDFDRRQTLWNTAGHIHWLHGVKRGE